MILDLLYTYFAAGIANMVPVFVKNVKLLPLPIDGGKKLNGSRVFGTHKTWRGIVLGTIIGSAFFCLQRTLAQYGILEEYLLTDSLLFGILICLGALLGDLVDAFVKRRVGIKEGKPFPPWDKIDYILGSIALGSAVYFPGWDRALYLVFILFVITILVRYIGWKWDVNESAW